MKKREYLLHAGVLSCLLFLALLAGSCGNCRWVEDCRCEDGGYWDCTSYDAIIQPQPTAPNIGVKIISKQQSGGTFTGRLFTIVIKNTGNAPAQNLKYTLKISRPEFGSGFGVMTFVDETKDGFSLLPSDSIDVSRRISENIIISGCCIYQANVTVTYSDSQGKEYYAAGYLDD